MRPLLRRVARLLGPADSDANQDTWQVLRDHVSLHPSVMVGPGSSVAINNLPTEPRVCLTIDEDSHVFSRFVLLRPQASIRVGKRCQLGSSQLVSAASIAVGDDVIMAWGCTVLDSDNHSVYWDERQFDVMRCRKDYVETGGADIARSHDWSVVEMAPVTIGDKAWIGFGVTILKGVNIGEGAVIGAGSVVTSDVQPWHIAAGNPCRHIRPIGRSRDE